MSKNFWNKSCSFRFSNIDLTLQYGSHSTLEKKKIKTEQHILHKIITDILRIWLPVLDYSQGWPCIAHSCVHVTVYATNIPSYSDQVFRQPVPSFAHHQNTWHLKMSNILKCSRHISFLLIKYMNILEEGKLILLLLTEVIFCSLIDLWLIAWLSYWLQLLDLEFSTLHFTL